MSPDGGCVSLFDFSRISQKSQVFNDFGLLEDGVHLSAEGHREYFRAAVAFMCDVMNQQNAGRRSTTTD
jgi:hypothetical protein